MYTIFVGISVVHFFLFVLGAFFASKVVVVDNSYLAFAVLLRQVINRMANQGYLLGGEKSCRVVEELNVVYGHTMDEKSKGDVRGLEISEEVYPEKSASDGRATMTHEILIGSLINSNEFFYSIFQG